MMGGAWSQRLIRAFAALILILIVTFLFVHIAPGDPVRALLGPQASQTAVDAMRSELGLDQPFLAQFLNYATGILHGDFGTSIATGQPVSDLMLSRMTPTVILVVYAAVITIVLTVPLAALAATNHGGIIDHVIRLLPLLGLGLPAFWLALVLIQALAVDLGLFPPGGYGSSTPLAILHSLTLPAFVIAVSILPFTVQSLRVSMVEVFESDYVAAARARGVPRSSVLVHHVLRSAAVPTVVVLGLNIGWLIGNTLIVEKVFAIPGLGALLIDSTLNRDFPVVQGLALVIAILVIATNLLTEAARSALDPRLRKARAASWKH